MKYSGVAIPLDHVWSSPFTKWQHELSRYSSLDLAVAVTKAALVERDIDAGIFESLVLGITIPQRGAFFGAPTVAARIGATGISGPMINQACATAAAAIDAASAAVASGAGNQLVVTTDRTSNGPLLVYPTPSRPGGAPEVENIVQDDFARDPYAGTSMLAAAENVAQRAGITRQELDDLVVLRYSQYLNAVADDHRFHRRYMVPVDIQNNKPAVERDSGIRPVDRTAIQQLPSAAPRGVHTGATQTHPADGCAGAIITNTEQAREIAHGAGIVEVLATGFARVPASRMPEAPVPAAIAAMRDAGMTFEQLSAVTTHNPFAVNDIYFSKHTGIDLDKMNNYGSSIIWGHPQAPTGMRAIAELTEELTLRGGGLGLFVGCAAGDTAGAVVLRVSD